MNARELVERSRVYLERVVWARRSVEHCSMPDIRFGFGYQLRRSYTCARKNGPASAVGVNT